MKKLIFTIFFLCTYLISAQPIFTSYTEGNPVVPKGIGFDWDRSSLWWPNVSFIQDTFYLTYLATNDFPNSPLSVGLATSIDGYNFTKHPTPILQANGSDIELFSVSNGPLLKCDGTWYLYYNGISTDPNDPGKVIARANSFSPYGPWERENDTLLTVGESGEWDDAFVLPLSIVKNSDELVLYYFGGDVWPNPIGQVGMATSTDNGTTWEKYNGNPILTPGPEDYDKASIFGASIIKTGNQWEMFYTGESITKFTICYATSSDGKNWEKHGVVLSPLNDPLAVNLYEGPSVVRNLDEYFLYYDYGLEQAGIGLATAENLSGIIDVPNQFSTIQEGINAAKNGDTVLVSEGTYLENINFKGKAITVAGHFILDQDTSHVSKTIIDGSQPSDPTKGSVVTFNSGEDTNSVLCGLTITGGGGSGTEYVQGGGIIVFNSAATISDNIIKENVISAKNNKAAGGGICCHSENSTSKVSIIIGNTIINNKALTNAQPGGYGGGIDVRISNVKLINNTISHNVVGGGDYCYGPGIRVAHSNNSTVDGNTISFNYFSNSQSLGGGLFLVQNNSVHVVDNHFEGNSGTEGAGIADFQTNNTTISGNHFINNTTEESGGGIYNYQSNNTIISKNSFLNNNAEQFGGGIYLFESTLKIFDNKVKHNHAKFSGGGIYFNKVSDAEIKNNLIAYNDAVFGGGAISFIDNSSPLLINNTIVENIAESGGGLSLLMNSDPTIMNTILYGNKADSSGSQVSVLTEDCEPIFTYCDVEGGIANFSMYEDAFPFPGTYENNMESDPLFLDTDSFYIPTNSPCSNAGNPDAIYNDSDGSQNDVGWTGGSDLVTSIKEIISENGQLPNNFKLYQNYPNPFNPTTVIKYSIPSSPVIANEVKQSHEITSSQAPHNDNANVSMKVYDILGREIATLVNQKQNPGSYEVTWEANDQPSGVYFYQLETGSFRETKKMILLR